MITLDNLRDALRALCYEPSGDGTVYQKSWEETSAQVTVDFSKKRIGYPKDLGSRSTKTQLVTSPITRTSSYSPA